MKEIRAEKRFSKDSLFISGVGKTPYYRNRSGRSSQRKSFRLLEPEN
jgi:hypothetical protein